MEQEKGPKTFAEIEVEMKERGFALAGKESLAIFGFDAEAKQFRPVAFRLREDIAEEYRKKIHPRKEVHVELVDVPGANSGEESVYVFVRRGVQEV